MPTPTSDTSGTPHRHVRRNAAAESISSCTVLPFIATVAPLGATSGMDQPSSSLQRRDRA